MDPWRPLLTLHALNYWTPIIFVKSLQLSWNSRTRRWNLRVPDLQLCCSGQKCNLTEWMGKALVAPAMAARATCLLTPSRRPHRPGLQGALYRMMYTRLVDHNPKLIFFRPTLVVLWSNYCNWRDILQVWYGCNVDIFEPWFQHIA